MTHPFEAILREPEALLLIGDSSEDRFPALSYHAYTVTGRAFHCLDLGGLPASRGPTEGGVVYTKVEDLPAERGDLAVIWMKPRSAVRGVEAAHRAGCKRIWFSFTTGHREAVARARALGMEVVEIGRCPVYYLDGAPPICAWHTRFARVSGTRRRPPQTDPEAKRRELW